MRLISVLLFAVFFAFVESSVVVYLRSIYYPDGFTLPLKMIQLEHVWVELFRELSTIIMLATVGVLAGSTRWQRMAFFMIAFGTWDVFYYLWLKVILDWPSTPLDWDVLFLIPVPWIGPVIAPILISSLLISAGVFIVRAELRGRPFRPSKVGWALSSAGTILVLYTFMRDTNATLRLQAPEPFLYSVFSFGFACYVGAMIYEFVFQPRREGNASSALSRDQS